MNNFGTLKEAYNIRSRFLHGSPIDNANIKKGLETYSTFLDDLIREILTKIITSDYQKFQEKNNLARIPKSTY